MRPSLCSVHKTMAADRYLLYSVHKITTTCHHLCVQSTRQWLQTTIFCIHFISRRQHVTIHKTTAAHRYLYIRIHKAAPAQRYLCIQSIRQRLQTTIFFSIHKTTCETWTLTAELERRIQTFEMRCYRKIFGISFRDRITNEDVRNRVRAAIRPRDNLSIVKTRKLRWYGHVTRATGLANTIMQGTVPGGRRRGRPKKCWHDNIKEWTELPLAKTLRLAEDKDGWRKITKASVVPLLPPNG